MKIVGIAGGSGTGKSSVCYTLVDKDPEKYQVINFDDYQQQRVTQSTPRLHGMVNWDHPDIIRWGDLLEDITLLKNGKGVDILTWAHRSNPDYDRHKKMINRHIEPRPILLVEGYLALYDKRLRDLYNLSIYLELDDETRINRRDKDILSDDEYLHQVLLPMHKKYVAPTKEKANIVIDVKDKTIEEIATVVEDKITSVK